MLQKVSFVKTLLTVHSSAHFEAMNGSVSGKKRPAEETKAQRQIHVIMEIAAQKPRKTIPTTTHRINGIQM